MPEKIKIDTAILRNYLAQYKTSFVEHRLGANQEIFKWKAVKCFQDNWKIDAPDFSAMLKASLAKTDNLLVAANFFPRKMLEVFADAEPEKVRAMFRELFDEEADLVTRAKAFQAGAEKLLEAWPNYGSAYQDPNPISTYLWLHNPDKYYIYKYKEIKSNAEKLCVAGMPANSFDRMAFGCALYDAMRAELAKDTELVEMSRDSLTNDCYPDESLNTLTIDVGYFISKHEQINTGEGTRAMGTQDMSKNIILCGTPGTGKTYSTVLYAVSIVEEKPLDVIKAEEYAAVFSRYQKYKDDGLVAFTTFHQSFGYEEFIEGIRPVLTDEENPEAEHKCDVEYELHDGIFKVFCNKAGTPIGTGAAVDLGIGKAPTVWKVSLGGSGNNPTREECMKNEHIRIGFDDWGAVLPEDFEFDKKSGSRVIYMFHNMMQIGDLVFSCYSSKTIDAIGVITGDVEWHDEYPHYKSLRRVKWLVKGINEDIVDMNAGKIMTLATVYRLSVSVSDAIQILRKTNPGLFNAAIKIPNRVFIIDEINRGNISKIFGELIALIEPTKRIGAKEELRAVLPYSGQNFGVPHNVYIIGTMNTADRSIALIDTALRRRFSFVEMQPDSATLADIIVDGLDITEMLDTLNKRITVLLDREHTIGHSFLLPLKDNPSIEKLGAIFEKEIVPLLQEYFYDDYEKIQLVLGDNQKPDDSTRFIVKRTDAAKLFGNAGFDIPDYYEINREAFKRIDAYAFL